MLRVTLVLMLTVLGLGMNFLSPFYGLLLYTWYSFGFPLELTYGILEGSRLSFIVALSFIGSTVAYRKKFFESSPLTFLVIIFLLHAITSLAVQGIYSFNSILSETELLNKIALISIISPVAISSFKYLKYYILTLSLVVGSLAFYFGIFGLLAGSTFITGAGRIGDNNGYAVLLVTIIPLLFSLFPITKSKALKILLLALIAGTVAAVVLTFSRGGMIGLLIVIILLILKIKKRLLLPFLLFISLSFYYFYSSNQIVSIEQFSFQREFRDSNAISETIDSFQARMYTLLHDPEETDSGKSRIHFWKVAFEMAKDKPFWGVGLGRFRDEFDSYDFSGGEFGPARAVHSTYFMILSETGFVGLTLYLIMVFFCFKNFIYSARTLTKSGGKYKAYGRFISFIPIALTGYLISSSFVITFYQEIFWAIITMAIACKKLTKEAYESSAYQSNLS